MTETDLLTPREFAKYRRCSLRTLDRERADGSGCPYVRLGARILYRRCDIERYLEGHVRGGVGSHVAVPAHDEQAAQTRRGRARKAHAPEMAP
jgi:hypothetical protein